MYETDRLIYLQMQKTGSTHIAGILQKIFNGHPPNEGKGKHAKATKEQIGSGKLIVSSIRNPLDWYASLWTFGCSGKGGLRHRVLCSNAYATTESDNRWNFVYQDKDNAELFREWLYLLLNPDNRAMIAEDLTEDSYARHCGFMTYRYLRLCWKDTRAWAGLSNRVSTDELLTIDTEQCYVKDFIKLEALEDELCRVIRKIRVLSEAEIEMIYGALPHNASPRRLSLRELYTRETAEMLHRSDSLIFQKFGYGLL